MIGLHRKYPSVVRFGLTVAAFFAVAASVYAADPDVGQAQKQAINWTAICMFSVFVLLTLFITKWAAARTKSAADFYTAGGGITGFQNGLRAGSVPRSARRQRASHRLACNNEECS